LRTWHILTGEYPPHCGGVGDYTESLAEALADAGDDVQVWTPAVAPRPGRGRVSVHVLPDVFGRASRNTMEQGWTAAPGPVLLQYVPNALGAKGANLPFCRWFAGLRPRVNDVRVMFHEPYFYFTWHKPWAASNGLALVQRQMARALLSGADCVYYSTQTWSQFLSCDRAATLPIPSSIPVAADGAEVAKQREIASLGHRNAPLVGHFGTYGAHVATELSPIVSALVAAIPRLRLAFLGDGGPAFVASLASTHPEIAACAWAPGRLEPAAVASALRACDVLVQPYPDGITTRRTSVMAGLKNGVPTVSTNGKLTEPVWSESGAVALAPAGDAGGLAGTVAELLRDATACAALGQRGAAAYAAHFSMAHTVAKLRSGAAS
jgi:glycosyltransferase involved in cell wall biosynthesis